jgi:lipoyl(octanoyl) transferase
VLLNQYPWSQAKSLERTKNIPPLKLRELGLQDYKPIWEAMRYLVENADDIRSDEIWLLSHKPVYTLGQAAGFEHVIDPREIPVIKVDRGGQVTYHGPGQIVGYLLINVKRRQFGVREIVNLIELVLIDTLNEFGVLATTKKNAPGVYVNDAKIASLGLRVRNGWCYHGLSLNVSMDTEPFLRINPCGFKGLRVAQVSDFVAKREGLLRQVQEVLSHKLLRAFGYDSVVGGN